MQAGPGKRFKLMRDGHRENQTDREIVRVIYKEGETEREREKQRHTHREREGQGDVNEPMTAAPSSWKSWEHPQAAAGAQEVLLWGLGLQEHTRSHQNLLSGALTKFNGFSVYQVLPTSLAW